MKLITYEQNGVQAVGLLHQREGMILPVRTAGLSYDSMNDLIERATEQELERLRQADRGAEGFSLPLAEVQLLAPIPQPRQDVICLGLNYTEHAQEAAAYARDSFISRDGRCPVYFSKRVGWAPGDGAGIPAHEAVTERLDYEVELAVIIGRDAKNVPPEEASRYIFGYTVCNDVSARDLQTAHTQWYFGKSLDGFTPLGPVIVTADEIPFPPRLKIMSRVNGELRQSSTTDMLLFGIDYIVSNLSQGMTLRAGSIIATGTPKGVGMGFDPPKFLRKGDVVECEIEAIGTLTNPIV